MPLLTFKGISLKIARIGGDTMSRAYEHYQRLMQRMDIDKEFQTLTRQRLECEYAFFTVLETLSPNDREAICAYMDACESQFCRVLELAFDIP